MFKELLKKIVRSISKKSVTADIFFSKLRYKLLNIKNKTTLEENCSSQYPIEVVNRNLNLFEKFIDLESLDQYDIAEIGPGDNLTNGFLLLEMGAHSWTGFDAYPYASVSKSYEAFLETLKTISTIVSESDYLNYEVESLRNDSPFINKQFYKIANSKKRNKTFDNLNYISPYSFKDLGKNRFDLIYSQACFEHIKNIETFYSYLYESLKQDGLVLTHIDFASHSTSMLWNGHYRFSRRQANSFQERYSFDWINFLKPTDHINIIKKNGFEILHINRSFCSSSLKKSDIPYQSFSNPLGEFDLHTRNMTMVLKKN